MTSTHNGIEDLAKERSTTLEAYKESDINEEQGKDDGEKEGESCMEEGDEGEENNEATGTKEGASKGEFEGSKEEEDKDVGEPDPTNGLEDIEEETRVAEHELENTSPRPINEGRHAKTPLGMTKRVSKDSFHSRGYALGRGGPNGYNKRNPNAQCEWT